MSTLTPAPYAHVGDLIQTANGQLFRVTAVKQVNYGVVDEDGKQWNLRKTAAHEAPAGAVFSGPEASAPPARRPRPSAPPRTDLTLGTVVEFRPGSKFHGKGKYVVVRLNTGGTYSMARLNGDGGRYIRGAHGSHLDVVTAV